VHFLKEKRKEKKQNNHKRLRIGIKTSKRINMHFLKEEREKKKTK
jgi:hypothetical protein